MPYHLQMGELVHMHVTPAHVIGSRMSARGVAWAPLTAAVDGATMEGEAGVCAAAAAWPLLCRSPPPYDDDDDDDGSLSACSWAALTSFCLAAADLAGVRRIASNFTWLFSSSWLLEKNQHNNNFNK